MHVCALCYTPWFVFLSLYYVSPPSHLSCISNNMISISAEGIFREKQHVLVFNSDRLEVFSDCGGILSFFSVIHS